MRFFACKIKRTNYYSRGCFYQEKFIFFESNFGSNFESKFGSSPGSSPCFVLCHRFVLNFIFHGVTLQLLSMCNKCIYNPKPMVNIA